ncbi:alpha/beta hydrolase [Flammeovirga sp. MY04]|uniref:alpha/beta hydrolase n=1 Tax=Flammeovirga sp. MY04 TaxID=1191459 RepID=UPI00080619B1|nr:alpha/beta hydrolase [Flammeovirga sp. MY04]ANQ51420.1 alpha/beta hydrolase [Flammeovirga sp. MY04]
MNKQFILLLMGFLVLEVTFAQEKLVFKNIDSLDLHLEVYRPEKMKKGKAYPAMVFYFGGGWVSGSTNQFKTQAIHYAEKGIICFLAEYRVTKRNNSTPFQSLTDAKSAIRFIRKNAEDLQVDPTKIIASGGSAGGHLAAATATIEGYNEPTDDLSYSCRPNALVLFNPVIDNGPGGYGFDRVGMAYKSFSPLHNIVAGAPPTIILIGDNDHLIPVTTVEYYQHIMEKVGSRCDLKVYEGGKHGFFNYSKKDKTFYKRTLKDTDDFLESLGYTIIKSDRLKPIVE